MATINRLILLWFLLFTGGCKVENLEKAANDLREQVCADRGVYHVGYGDRFGDNVIAIFAISDEDRSRIIRKLGSHFNGFQIHVSSPIWGIGQLIPQYRERIDSLRKKDIRYSQSWTPEHKELDVLYQDAQKEEKVFWEAMEDSKKAELIGKFILDMRRRGTLEANCGDKFLNPPPPPPTPGQ